MPTTTRRTPPVPRGTADLDSLDAKITALAERVEELFLLVQQLIDDGGTDEKPLTDSEIRVGTRALTKVTGQMVVVEVKEIVQLGGKTQYFFQRLDNGRKLNSPRPSSALYRAPAER